MRDDVEPRPFAVIAALRWYFHRRPLLFFRSGGGGGGGDSHDGRRSEPLARRGGEEEGVLPGVLDLALLPEGYGALSLALAIHGSIWATLPDVFVWLVSGPKTPSPAAEEVPLSFRIVSVIPFVKASLVLLSFIVIFFLVPGTRVTLPRGRREVDDGEGSSVGGGGGGGDVTGVVSGSDEDGESRKTKTLEEKEEKESTRGPWQRYLCEHLPLISPSYMCNSACALVSRDRERKRK